MAEPAPIPVSTNTLEYRPLSGLAVASLVVAVVYAVVVAIFGAAAFSTGIPVFMGTWTLVFPMTAAVLAVVAQWQIRNSEGTRTGLSLAKWGLRLSLFFGIGYGALYLGSYLAVWLQAEAEVKRFFDKLRAGKTDEAFELTLDPAQRASIAGPQEMMMRYNTRGQGGQKSPLAKFKENEIVRILQQGGPGMEIQSLGVKDWRYENKGGYKVEQTYRIKAPEGTFDILVVAQSSESKEFKGRRWRVVWEEASTRLVDRTLSPLGQTLEQWRMDASGFARQWLGKREAGHTVEMFLDTREAGDRNRLRLEYQVRLMAAGVVAGPSALGEGPGIALSRFAPLLNLDLGCETYLPGYVEFTAGGFIDAANFEASKKLQAEIPAMLKQLVLRPRSVGIVPRPIPCRPAPPEKGSIRYRFLQDVELPIYANVNDLTKPAYVCDGEIEIESDRAPTSPGETPEWRFVRLRLVSGAKAPETGPAAPPGPKPGR